MNTYKDTILVCLTNFQNKRIDFSVLSHVSWEMKYVYNNINSPLFLNILNNKRIQKTKGLLHKSGANLKYKYNFEILKRHIG